LKLKGETMDQRATEQILLARYYLYLAGEQLRHASGPSKFAAINMYHEAFEATLICCADHLNVSISSRATVEAYLDKIDQAINPATLPFRSRILQFNHARVAAKHHLNLPDDAVFTMIQTVVPEFIKEAVRLIFNTDIEELSLVNLVEEGDIRTHISAAVDHLKNDRIYEALTAARRAIYLQIEQNYSIFAFTVSDMGIASDILGPRTLSSAPQYAKSTTYIEKHVTKPTDYIVLDHSRINADLLNDGIDPNKFWNIWRLTPRVFRFPDGAWVADYEYDIADDPEALDHCRYVIDNVISITLQRQGARKRIKGRDLSSRYIQVREGTSLLKRALAGSEVEGFLPVGVRRVNVDSKVTSLDGKDCFVKANYMRKGGPWLFGWIDIRDTIGEPQVGFVADGVNSGNFVSGNPDDDPIL
jgi:hypothetical protein